MERVDVVVVGATIEGLAAAHAAASGGVRTILLEREPLPGKSPSLHAIPRDAELDPGDAERTIDRVEDDRAEPDGPLDVVRDDRLRTQLLERAVRAGAETRDRLRDLQATRAEPDGWHLRPADGEPVRGRILILAEGPRAPIYARREVAALLEAPGDGADLASYLVATWIGRAAPEPAAVRVIHHGAFDRTTIVPGQQSITAAVGPIWRGVAAPHHDWASEDDPAVPALLRRAGALVGLSARPDFIELADVRIAPLPRLAVADATLVVGRASGLGTRRVLLDTHERWASGRAAGAAAAQAILAGDTSELALARAPTPELAALLARTHASLAADAASRGRHPAPEEAWRSARR